MDWELLEGCSSYFPSPTWKTGSNLYSTFWAPPKKTRLFPPILFLEVSVIISDDLYEMLVLFGSLPITKKIYTHHNLFSLGKNLSALFGAVIFWSKTWNQGITCWFLSWDPADFADVFAPKPSIKKCSAPLAFFFKSCFSKPANKKNKVLFVQWVKRRDNSPRFKIQDDGAVLVTKKEFCLSHLPFCARPWPWQKNSIFGCKSAGGELGGNDLSDQSSRRIIHCKGCADVHLQQEYTKNWGYLHHLTSIESIDNNSSILEYYSAHTLRFPADSADSWGQRRPQMYCSLMRPH